MIVEIENIGFYTVKIDRIVVGDETTNINDILNINLLYLKNSSFHVQKIW